MLIFTRVTGFLLAIVGLVAAATIAWFALAAGALTFATSTGDLQAQASLQGSAMAREIVAGVAVLFGLIIALPALLGAFMRPRTVPVWLNGQQQVSMPEESVEQYLQARVNELRDVEDAHIDVRSNGERTVVLGVDLVVGPDADAGAVTARVEECIQAALVSSCGIILEHRPSIRIRHAESAHRGSRRQAA